MCSISFFQNHSYNAVNFLQKYLTIDTPSLARKGELCGVFFENNPDSKVHGAYMGPIWGRQDPGGPHVVPVNFAIWEILIYVLLRLR